MALPVTPKPRYPNVPNAPGVPNMLRAAGQVQNTVVALVSDVQSLLNLFQGPQWGIFDSSGKPAFGGQAASGIVAAVLSAVAGGSGQSVSEVEYRLDHRLSTAPQEQGAFLTYNKVSTPFAGRVTYVLSGTASQRAAFLAAVLKAQQGTALYSLVMPEYTYPSCSIVHHDLRRMAVRGISMFAVDIWVEEVRIVQSAAYSNTAAPSGSLTVNNGSVQPQVPTPAQRLAAGTAPL